MANFPSRLSQQGAHHLDLNDSAFGPFKADGSLSVSGENDATDAADTDGRQNIGQPAGDSDQDGYDDGLLTATFAPGVNNQVDFLVSVAPGAPKQTRYVNMLADWNQDGVWSNASGQTEWIVQNMPIDVTPGTTATLKTPEFLAGALTSPVWLRMTLSDAPIDGSIYPAGWNGQGEFAVGETEDYLLTDHVAMPLPNKNGGGGGAPTP